MAANDRLDSIVCRASMSIGRGDEQAYNLGDLDKLPAEIRNEIYRFCLTTEEPLIVARARHGAGVCKRHQGCVRIAHSKQFCLIVTTLTVPKRTKKVPTPAGKVIPGRLLRASKAIQKESTPVLYRDNHFEFDTTRVLYDFFRTFTVTAPLLANIDLYNHLNHPHDLDVLGNIQNPKRILIPSWSFYEYDHFAKEMRLSAWRGMALKPYIQRLCARPGSSSGRNRMVSVEKQLQRLDTIQFGTYNGIETSDDGDEEKREAQIKIERERLAGFRELMVKEIEKDAREIKKKKTK